MPDDLSGTVALVTRPQGQGSALCAAIRASGGEAVEFPLLAIDALHPPDAAFRAALASHGLAIFVSTNAVTQATVLLERTGASWPESLRCLAVGDATRAALRAAGLPVVEANSQAMNSEELLAQPLLRDVRGRRVLILKGEGGRELLAAVLRERGACVEELALYRRSMPAVDDAAFADLLRERGVNAFLANSAETLANLLGLLARVPAGTIRPDSLFVVPGERIAAEAEARVPGRLGVARNASDAAMLAALRAKPPAGCGATEAT
ncbi:MAG: uroporphyrinogen-III synthase [Gammaproteobacteria bacterium]